jgi:hypothetical protein
MSKSEAMCEPTIVMRCDRLGAGAWSILPALEILSEEISKETQWILFIEDDTLVNAAALGSLLSQYDPSQELLIGRGQSSLVVSRK